MLFYSRLVLFGLSFFSASTFASSLSIAIMAISVMLFGAGNYKLLTSKTAKYGYVLEELEDSKDYKGALEFYYEKEKNYKEQIGIAMSQIDMVKDKQETLITILYQNNKEHYTSVIDTGKEAESLIYDNTRKILNRIMAISHTKGSNVNLEHKEYIEDIINKNKEILSEFDKMLIEVSKIGENDNIHDSSILTDMTNILKKQRGEKII